MPVSRWSRSRSRSVLSIAPFRRLWFSVGFSTIGEWAAVLATIGLAASLAAGSYTFTCYAIAGVLLLWLLPPVLGGPLGGHLAARLDRRRVVVVGALVRCALVVSLPLVGDLAWTYVVVVLSSGFGLVCRAAAETELRSRVRPDVRPDLLPSVDRLLTLTTYVGGIPVAVGYSALVLTNEALTATLGWFDSPVDLALYAGAAAFLLAALVASRPATDPDEEAIEPEQAPAPPVVESPGSGDVWRALLDGRRALAGDRTGRRLVFAMVTALAAAGVMLAVGRVYIADLGAADAGFGVVVTALFTGLVLGVTRGHRILGGLSRRRRLGLALTGAGLLLLGIALGHSRTLVVLLTGVLGLLAGVAWAHGRIVLRLLTDDRAEIATRYAEARARLALAIIVPGAAATAGAIGPHAIALPGGNTVQYDGAAITISLAALVVIVLGVSASKQLDDREGMPLMRDLKAALGDDRGVFADRGLFIAFEGGEGSGKSTQAAILAEWLTDRDYDAILTHQPGGTEIGREIRELVLHRPRDYMAPRTEALLYAADKAEHVDTLIRPALERGAAVITDRYVDSALAYQGGGRELEVAEVRLISRWATGGLRPHLTVLLDVPPEVGLARLDGDSDRLEQESLEFHETVRQHFLDLAALDPDRYVVVDATQGTLEIAARIRASVEPMLSAVHRRTPTTERT